MRESTICASTVARRFTGTGMLAIASSLVNGHCFPYKFIYANIAIYMLFINQLKFNSIRAFCYCEILDSFNGFILPSLDVSFKQFLNWYMRHRLMVLG